jgi:hypothetical protein
MTNQYDRLRRTLKVVALALMVAAGARSASACSVTSDYVRPTNFELIQLADAIVVATAVKQTSFKWDGAVEFRIDTALKGPAPQKYTSNFAALGKTWPSNADDISASHPEGHRGPCNRMTFAKDKQYILFLKRDAKGGYAQLGYAFSRVNEDYQGEGSLWVRTIRAYLDIQKRYSPMEQLDVLEALLQEKLNGPQTPTSKAEALDILDHLRSRSPWKPTAYLLQTYETLERGEQPKYGVRSRAADRENSVAQDMTDAVLGRTPPADKMSLEGEKALVLRSLVLGEHPAAAPLFERLVAVPRPRADHLGLAIRFFAKNNAYRRAYALVETAAMKILAAIDQQETLQLLNDIYHAQRGETHQEGKERWRSDPYVAASWPELALHLFWFQHHMFGSPQLRDTGAIGAIAVEDYRARPMATLALAASYDEPVEKWVFAELVDEKKRTEWESKSDDDKFGQEDPALLPVQALVLAFGDARDKVIERVACQSAARRALLIDALGDFGDSLDRKWLARVAATPPLSEDERSLLGQALARYFSRHSMEQGGGLFGSASGYAEYEMLENVIRGEKITVETAEPLRCPK